MYKVYMLPTPKQAANDTTNAINQIVLKLQKYLPAYGFELVENLYEADLVAGHAGQTSGHKVVDVAHVHGLYPTFYSHLVSRWHFGANRSVINNVITAKRVTVPSQWVADLFRRDMRIDPAVIGWAIDHKDWGPAESGHYVLWNKTRVDGICDPTPLNQLARSNPSINFVSTFGDPAHNVKITGRQLYNDMRGIIQHAHVYLATTKETFGIGTLEAMASGIPILGYNWGGTADIVEHGVTGFLAEPGDMQGLSDGLKYCMENRAVLGKNAMKRAAQYTWDRVAERFAAIYTQVLEEKKQEEEGIQVSVVIPCYNYSRYIKEAINSVLQQKTLFNFEIIVVDDGSIDNSGHIAEETFEESGVKTATVIYQKNGGVANARNRGIKASKGRFIVCLDADDLMGSERMLQTLFDGFSDRPDIGITYTGLSIINEDNTNRRPNEWPPSYDYDEQVIGHNQVPTCCMFRKDAWERVGGYRQRYKTGEDANFWLRIGALGYKGLKVTGEPMFYYRLHSNSLSSHVRSGTEKESDWFNLTWLTQHRRPFASDGNAVNTSWPVRNYDQPLVSIIIPVGPGHEQLLSRALDSVENQTEYQWEAVVINDTGHELDLKAYPYVRLIETEGKRGSGYARNVGVKAAKASLIVFLDADDELFPEFLAKTIELYTRTGRYVYTDWLSYTLSDTVEKHETADYNLDTVMQNGIIHSNTCLIPKKFFLEVGGYDETMPAWEDAELFMNFAAHGFCGVRLPEPLFAYYYKTGYRRETVFKIFDSIKDRVYNKYSDYINGVKTMCCGDSKPTVKQTAKIFASEGSKDQPMVRIEYTGPAGMMTVVGAATGQRYGRHEKGDFFFVYEKDAEAQPELYNVIQTSVQPVSETTIPDKPEAI